MTILRWTLPALLVLGLAACGGDSSTRPAEYSNYSGPECTLGPRSKYGNPASYEVMGKRYYVRPTACGFKQRGIASWYGPGFHGKRTSSGEVYDMHGMTAAHKTLPLPAKVKVTNLDTGESLVVRVNDRGPFHEGRIIDLSKAAAQRLGVIKHGTVPVEIETVGTASERVSAGRVVQDYSNRFFVQVGSFSERGNAENLLSKLLADGFSDVQIQSVVVNGGTVSRVRLGPVSTPVAANTLSNRLNRLGYRGHRVLTE
ncbi:rare lipoprotein A [gamma proteobacterium HTCC5015]|nr:rare lipoprotein A [gamma proteobacterium HTCC5015]